MSEDKSQYDVVVIDSGPGGYVAAIRCAQLGLKTACVERERLGGICLNWGCIPTKALLRSAEVLDNFRHASDFGIKVGSVEPDFPAIIARSRGVADKVSKGVGFLLRKNKIDHVPGTAKLLPRAGAWRPHEVHVALADGGERTLTTKHVIVATGARARSLPGLELDGERIIEYRKAMTAP
jgi:dihydrolipoamide dehydrogenase